MKTLQLIDNGGPAFPQKPIYSEQHGWTHPSAIGDDFAGMTLRDFFAAHEHLSDYDKETLYISKDIAIALVGREMPMAGSVDYFTWDAEVRAAIKYIRADALIRQRGKETQ